MNKSEYARRWASTVDHPSFVRVDSVEVPANVERVFEHTPCFMCGTARGICKHRRAVA